MKDTTSIIIERTLSCFAAGIVAALTVAGAHPANMLTQASVDRMVEARSVTVVYTDDPAVNCTTSPRGGGCFRTDAPDTIYVSPDLKTNEKVYVMLHELAHVDQYRTGAPLDDCEADRTAVEWGAPAGLVYYVDC